jgi:hypothetical protein
VKFLAFLAFEEVGEGEAVEAVEVEEAESEDALAGRRDGHGGHGADGEDVQHDEDDGGGALPRKGVADDPNGDYLFRDHDSASVPDVHSLTRLGSFASPASVFATSPEAAQASPVAPDSLSLYSLVVLGVVPRATAARSAALVAVAGQVEGVVLNHHFALALPADRATVSIARASAFFHAFLLLRSLETLEDARFRSLHFASLK